MLQSFQVKLFRTCIGFAVLAGTASFTGRASDVFVCDSSTSFAYHQFRSCRGLNRCTHRIISVSKTEAVDTYKKRACKICY